MPAFRGHIAMMRACPGEAASQWADGTQVRLDADQLVERLQNQSASMAM